jgi:hypothetical protein
LLKEFNTKKLKNYLIKFKDSIKRVRHNNDIKKFVEAHFEEDIFRVSCFQGEDTFNERLKFICDKYINCGIELKRDVEIHLRNLFGNIILKFVDENSNAIIHKSVNNKLDTIMVSFEKQLKKEINKERKFKTINHYFEDTRIYKELQNIIDNKTNYRNTSEMCDEIKKLCMIYKKLPLEERQKQNIVDALTNYENDVQNKNILDNINSVIQEYINKEIIEWINCDLCEFIRNNDNIKEDDKIREKRFELNQDIKKYEQCLHILKN